MNNDLISREAAIRAIRRKCIFAHIPFKSASREGQRTLEALNAVWEVPAVDAVPMVHARWNLCSDDGCELHIACSRCGHEPVIGTKTPYCPNCGAKMDKEATNAD